MRTHQRATLALLVSLAAGCATAPAPRADFGDVPVPPGLVHQAGRSTTIESPNVKAARHVYRTRLEPDSLAALIRASLEGSGWRQMSGTSAAANGAIQLYQKGNDTLHVRVWEGGLFNWYTYVEYAAARVAPSGLATATK
jgi:hypothetical protein